MHLTMSLVMSTMTFAHLCVFKSFNNKFESNTPYTLANICVAIQKFNVGRHIFHGRHFVKTNLYDIFRVHVGTYNLCLVVTMTSSFMLLVVLMEPRNMLLAIKLCMTFHQRPPNNILPSIWTNFTPLPILSSTPPILYNFKNALSSNCLCIA